MALSIKNLKKVTADKPPRILLYGPPGIGKTTLASEFENPVFIQIEDGTPGGMELTSFGKLDSYEKVMEAVEVLYNDEHDFKTVVIDSVTEFQKLVFRYTCEQGDEKGNAKANIEDFGYGKGYVYAQRGWEKFLDALNYLRDDRGMSIVLIAHSKIERFDDPETVSYDRYEIDLHNKCVGALERDMDAILLLKRPVNVDVEEKGFNKERARAQSTSVILIHAVGRPAFTAKNRYDIPATVRFDRGKGFEALSQYFNKAKSLKKAAAEQKVEQKNG